MNDVLAAVLYLVAAVAFILGLKRLSSPATARAGNQLAAVGMLIAIVVTLLDKRVVSYPAIIAAGLLGSAIGGVAATRVQMTAMPQMVAAFNGFGGGASALVATAELLSATGNIELRTEISVALSIIIGAVTFSGSFIAYGKLQGLLSGSPITYRGQVYVDSAAVTVMVGLGVWLVATDNAAVLWVLMGVALLVGVLRTIPIGGADMPVVIALLNALSGLAASSAGFVIDSNALIISGALVGSSGIILASIMARAMNRSLPNILFGAFGVGEGTVAVGAGDKPVRAATPDDVAIALAYAEHVIVVPGYGLAVSQAQHRLRELADLLEARGVEVRYAIHPVAGRMPGHMNVLLAEADVPYDKLFDLDINHDFPNTDVALVIGANDVVNPLARDPNSVVAGMPILDVDKAKTVVVVKRSLSPGFAGIDNPLFYLPNTMMFFADAKKALEQLLDTVPEV